MKPQLSRARTRSRTCHRRGSDILLMVPRWLKRAFLTHGTNTHTHAPHHTLRLRYSHTHFPKSLHTQQVYIIITKALIRHQSRQDITHTHTYTHADRRTALLHTWHYPHIIRSQRKDESGHPSLAHIFHHRPSHNVESHGKQHVRTQHDSITHTPHTRSTIYITTHHYMSGVLRASCFNSNINDGTN